MMLTTSIMFQISDYVTLPIELTNAEGTLLQHMNEYCLLEIFSHSLDPMDLCSLAETCARFKKITQLVFPKEFSISSGTGSTRHRRTYLLKSENDSSFFVDVEDLERFLKNFGSHFTRLTMRDDQPIVRSLFKYYNSISISHLTIERSTSLKGFKAKMKSVFKQLQTLVIDNCKLDIDSSTFESKCDSLIELTILKSTGCDAILRNTFPNLKRFTFHDDHRNDTLSMFIGRHKRLRSLNLFVASCNSDLVQRICQNSKKLAKLKTLSVSVTFFGSTGKRLLISLLHQASHLLDKVKIHYMHDNQVEAFHALAKMENLRELHFYDSKLIIGLRWTMLTQLRKLVMHFGSNFNVILDVIRDLPEIEDIQFENHVFMLKEEQLLEIFRIVEGRANVLTLRCDFDKKCLEYCGEGQIIKLEKIKY